VASGSGPSPHAPLPRRGERSGLDIATFIATRRDKGTHTRDELTAFAQAVADGAVPDYQLSAWLMAAFLNPLSLEETAWLTHAMADSGEIMDLNGLPKPWVDKHSTGGVGDKTTLVLLPMLAACGLTVVKMSGRGLGITGGTLDKLSVIPGFRTNLTPDEMKEQAKRIGLALTGQTPNLAPADKVLYALRDTTGTVGSIPLIVSSVLSKKVAGGAETIVLDVKCGSGGLVQTEPEARQLAKTLAEVGKLLNLKVRIALTDMSQPLGSACGNALEVKEAVEILTNRATQPAVLRFRTLCIELAALTLQACGLKDSPEDSRKAAEGCLAEGKALEKFQIWCEAQGATVDVTAPDFAFEPTPLVKSYPAAKSGWISKMDAQTVGRGVLRLGGGRKRKEDLIDPRVGMEIHAPVGSRVTQGEPLFTIHATDEDTAEKVAGRTFEGIAIADAQVEPKPLILDLF
jgi:pyrimidine-nucleoside phosphorylase